MENRKLKGRLWILLVLVLALLIPATASAGSTVSTATNLVLNGGYVRGSITTTTSTEYYKIVLTKPAYLSIDTRGYLPRLNVQFYNKDLTWKMMGGDHYYNGTSNQPGSWRLGDYFEAGTYYIKFSKSYDYTGTYDIKASFTPTNNVESSNDSNVSGANALALNGSYKKGLISVRDDVDY